MEGASGLTSDGGVACARAKSDQLQIVREAISRIERSLDSLVPRGDFTEGADIDTRQLADISDDLKRVSDDLDDIDVNGNHALRRLRRVEFNRCAAAEKRISGLVIAAADAEAVAPSLSRCFTRNTVVQTADGHLVRVEELAIGDKVIDTEGSAAEVLSAVPHPVRLEHIVELATPTKFLRVTGSHRIVIKTTSGEDIRAARELKEGSWIVSRHAPEQLREVRHSLCKESVIELAFENDVTVEGFYIASEGLGSKGQEALSRTEISLPCKREDEEVVKAEDVEDRHNDKETCSSHF